MSKAEFGSYVELKPYLSEISPTEAHFLAVRSSLRVMPLLYAEQVSSLNEELFLLSAFRCNLMACAYHFSDRNVVAREAVRAADFLIKKVNFPNHLYSLCAAIFSAEAVVERKSTYLSIENSANSIERHALNKVFWRETGEDFNVLLKAGVPALLNAPLWQSHADTDIMDQEFDRNISRFGGSWYFLIEFYNEILRNGISNHIRDFFRVLFSKNKSIWNESTEDILRIIYDDWTSSSTSLPFSLSNSQVDFFISYATPNEEEAREINGYLVGAGYNTVVQFKDFGVGSNFVTEMQKGLHAERMVSLLSPAYVASKQCQAEWNAAYNRDPSGEHRYLVPILVEKSELPPLAKQIVYKSLVGLTGDARRRAVLEAIGKLRRPEVPGVRSPYEFELTPNQTITAVAGAMNTVSVLPNRDPNDAGKRLEASRDIANDLIAGLVDNRFQVGRHYVKELENYRDRLPLDATESIYSADAALRNLRDDLESDLRHGICDRFAPRLQRLIEAHYGLRVYFPELLDFYDDVKRARQAEPPPLEALGKLRQIVADNTPDVFEPSVDAAFGHAVDVARPATEEQETSSDGVASSSAPSTLPPDPIAGVDPVRAAQHAEMSMQNRIWAMLRRVEEGGKTAERVDKAVSSYAKWIDPVLDWLSKSN